MPRPRHDDITPYLERLRAFAIVEDVAVEQEPKPGVADYRLTVTTKHGRKVYRVEVRGGALGYPLADHLVARMRETRERWLLAAPYIPAPLGEHLIKAGIDWIDDTGNGHLDLGRAGIFHIEGRRPPRTPAAARQLGTPGHQVVLALLAHPELTHAPVREVAVAAGVGKTLAAEVLAKLREEGTLLDPLPPNNRRQLLDLWVAGYATAVRPAWFAGRFRTQARDPEEVEQQLAKVFRGDRWALGGAAAAWRIAPHVRVTDTVVHLPAPPVDLARRLRALPGHDGNLTVLVTPCPVVYEGLTPNTAHPLVVYAELLTTRDDRAIEAATTLREKLLTP